MVVRAIRFMNVVVVCGGGSEDLTGEIAGALGAVVVRHEMNLGYGPVIGSLFRKARSFAEVGKGLRDEA